MILDCCAQQRTYEKFFGLLAQRFCSIHQKYVAPFETIFKDTYDTGNRINFKICSKFSVLCWSYKIV